MTAVDPTLIAPEASIRQAIELLNASVAKIALVVDASHRLQGTVTDGDIRRGILRGVGLEDAVSRVMNAHPSVATVEQTHAATVAQMRRDGFRHMPVVDAAGRVVRLAVLSELLEPERRENIVVLMAGGLGARMRELTADRPKPLLKVGNKPILESILEAFISDGFARFYLAVNYKREMVESHFGDGSRWGVSIEYLREETALGTAGALSLLPQIPNRPLLLMNGDILTNVNFENILTYHRERGGAATVAVREYDVPVPYGVVDVEGDRLARIREKPVFQFLVNAGIYVLEPDVLRLIPKNARFDMPELFNAMLSAGRPVSVFPLREYWIDIGHREDFARANGDFDQVFG